MTDFAVCRSIDVSRSVYSNLMAWIPGSNDLVTTACEPGARSGLLLVSSAGGTRWLTPPPAKADSGDMQPAFSPDGRSIAFARRVSAITGDIYVAPFRAESRTLGEPRRITDLSRLTGGMTWLPDGESLVFSAGGSVTQHLFRVSIDSGAAPEPLHWAGSAALQPSVSGSGPFVFTRRTSDANIWRRELPVKTGQTPVAVRLIASTALDTGGEYSPDGSTIAFASTRSGTHQIWTCASEGSRCLQLTRQFTGALVSSPRWSPDGRLVAFNSNHTGNYDVYVVKASEKQATHLTDNTSDDSQPSFSPDGTHIYFTSTRSGTAQIWRMAADGRSAVQITSSGGLRGVPSADGEWVYYTGLSKEGGRMATLWKMPADRNGPSVRLIDAIYPLAWAITGTGVWYYSAGDPETGLRLRDFVTGRDLVKTSMPNPRPPSDTRISASPDGRFLLYAQEDNPGSDLMMVQNAQRMLP